MALNTLHSRNYDTFSTFRDRDDDFGCEPEDDGWLIVDGEERPSDFYDEEWLGDHFDLEPLPA